ncbi:MAG: hypothetical protein WC273_04705 [Dehalococcoidia bacterium]
MDTAMTTILRRVDRWFRIAGVATLLALAVTIAMLLGGVESWRVPFVAAHLAALAALLPLGIALVVLGYREAGGPGAMLARHWRIVLVLAVIAASVTVTGMEFTANRDIRRVSNIVTVSLVVLLVVQYLRWYGRRSGRYEAHSAA